MANTMEVEVSFSGLPGATTASHTGAAPVAEAELLAGIALYRRKRTV